MRNIIFRLSKMAYLFLCLQLLFLFVGCGKESGAFSEKHASSVDDNEYAEETSKTEYDYPRNLSAYAVEDLQWELGDDPPLPKDFFDKKSLLELNEVSKEALDALTFDKFPDEEMLKGLGNYNVTILAGNMRINTKLCIVDTTSPVITVPEEQTYYRGDNILYKKGMTVSDNSGIEPDVFVDTSEVSPNMKGEYYAYYEAVDPSGNKGTAYSKIIILDDNTVTKGMVDELAKELIESLISENMSDIDKAKSIFDWCNGSIKTAADADKSDVMVGAYDGLYYREGDCYTVYATAKYLMDMCDIENISVSKKESEEATHYWSLVYIDGGWYHFDPSRHDPKWACFLKTDAQVDEYARTNTPHPDYYQFDEEDVPARATRIIVGD